MTIIIIIILLLIIIVIVIIIVFRRRAGTARRRGAPLRYTPLRFATPLRGIRLNFGVPPAP